MQDPLPESKMPNKSILRRVWFWILVGLVLVVVLFFVMLPVAIDYGIEAYLEDQGADQVSLADVDFNPLTSRMTLTNLTVVIGEQTVLQIPQATFKIEWTPFVRKRFVLERFTINDLELIVEQLEDGNWRIGGVTIVAQEASAEPASWGFSFQEATATNCKIKLISSKLKSDLAIEEAKISKLTSWLYDDNARLELTGKLNDAPMQLQLDVSPFGSEILASGQIQLNGLTLKPFSQLLQPHLKTLAGRLDLDLNIETRRAADNGIDHFQKGSVKLHQLHIQMADMNLSKKNLAWNGAVRVNLAKSQEGMKFSADGQLNGSRLTLDSENENLKLQQDNFDWKGKIDYVKDDTGRKINTDGQIGLVGLQMESPQLNLAEEKLTWKGALQFSSMAETEGQRIITDGTLEGNDLLLGLPRRKLKLEHQGLSWRGHLDTGEANDYASLNTKADITFKDIKILHSETNQRLFNSQRVDLQTVQVEGLDKISVAGIALTGLALLAAPATAPASEADPTPLHIQEVKFENVRLSQQKDLAINAVRLTGVKGFLHRDREGKWPAVDQLASIRSDISSADQKQSATSDIQANKKSNEFDFRIGQIDISGDSGLQFKDDSVSPAFGLDLNILEAHVADLDSSQPQQPASLKLLLSDNKDARLSLGGTLQPFDEKVNLDWIGKIEALELPPLSPYVIQHTGFRFVSGEMQADIPVKIKENQLDGKIDLILYNPTVERVKEQAQQEKKQGKIGTSIPLDSALKLQRDKQNNVKLKIPISGDISDPKFSIADAINKVLVKSLQTSVLSYLKFALGPYGIGLAVAEQAISGTAKIRLNPIIFAPGSAELDDAAIDYTQRVAKIMKEYPEVQVSACGVATASDRRAISGAPAAQTGAQSSLQTNTADTALLALAEQRSDQIRDQLVNVHGIDPKRIIDCEPKIAKAADANPRVDLDI
jgi:hypothetical protein